MNNEQNDFIIPNKISLREFKDEEWLQDIIYDNPSILELGNLEPVRREHTQPTGGRIDLILIDNVNDTLYEVEIQLGKTDPSHIIRTIEYWDNEKRRYPAYKHKAVIVAEEITSRFFNVIYLLNRYIPIVAIQLSALLIDDKIVLNFTKILDTFITPEEEIDSEAEEVNEDYWIKKTPQTTWEATKMLIQIITDLHENRKITYNKYHIAAGTSRRNFLWLRPRKSDLIHITMLIRDEDVERTMKRLEDMGLSPGLTKKRMDTTHLRFPLNLLKIEQYKEILIEVFTNALESSL